ncbi:lysophospholipase D GDPD1-like isoform X2 [Oratosquilla oratoria]|uniref:lysophospholipase D GDPD1-like isoform X2 n=1 Tax=Oratosquilla oratoria TaxID=337810 RepID=UPI003F75D8FF
MVTEMVIAAVIGCYIVSSLILFKFPCLLHKKKDVKFMCRHISHRGGAGENYENTITAFHHAVNLGTDMLELDCHLSKDGKVVVSHDLSLDRRTQSSGLISEYDYDDLPCMKEQVPIDFVPGASFSSASEDRNFPLLEDVFKNFPNTAINIDIKINNDNLISKNPNICLLFSAKSVSLLLLKLYTGLLPFMSLKETHLEVFVPAALVKVYSSYYPEKWWHHWVASIADVILIRRALFEHLAKRGIQTYLWVLNTEEEYRTAYESGATGVMTDYPTKLKHFLEANPQYARDNKLS